MRGVVQRVHAFWSAPEAAGNLAIARILVALHSLWILLSRDYAAMADVPGIFWRHASEASRLRYLIVPGAGDIDALLQGIAAMALIAAIVGVAPRVACFLAGVLLYHLAPYETLIWQAAPDARGLTLAPIALLVLAASPSGDAFSLWPRRKRRSPAELSAHYGWALRLVQMQVVAIYFFSAIGKVQRTGLDWGSAERMQLWLLWFNQDAESVVFGSLGPWMAQFAWLCGAIGVATVLFEWLSPLAITWRRSRTLFVVLALCFHVGTLLTMNIHVPETWLIVLLLDWSWSWRSPA